MHVYKAIVIPLAVSLCACATGDRVAVSELARGSRAVANLSDVMTNIKCDMLAFARDNPALRKGSGTFGGVLTVTVGRTNDASGGIKFGIPIASKTLKGELAASSKLAYGQTVKLPFHVDFMDRGDFAKCSDQSEIRKVLISEGDGQQRKDKLDGPILGLGELRRQLDLIIPGRPTISFTDFAFSGSVVLARSVKGDAGIDVVVINPSMASTISSEYKIEYDLGTNWQAILKKSGLDPDRVMISANMPPQSLMDSVLSGQPIAQ